VLPLCPQYISNKVYRTGDTFSHSSNTQEENQELSNSNPEKNEIKNLKLKFQNILNNHTNNMLKWMSTVLSIALKQDIQQIQSAINQVSEELFQCHLNIIKSVDSHIYIGIQPFTRHKKVNKNLDGANINSQEHSI